jgi:hypothetical protein
MSASSYCAIFKLQSKRVNLRSGTKALEGYIIGPMPKSRRDTVSVPPEDTLFTGKRRKALPHEFVLDAIAALRPRTNPMFGCLAVYVGEKIVLILRDKPGDDPDNGVWLATTLEHHESLRREFPNLRSIQLFSPGVTGWQVLRADAQDFEESALRACELIVAGDPRVGKVPKAKRTSKARARRAAKSVKPARAAKSSSKPRGRM